jgi:hypothetical protein
MAKADGDLDLWEAIIVPFEGLFYHLSHSSIKDNIIYLICFPFILTGTLLYVLLPTTLTVISGICTILTAVSVGRIVDRSIHQNHKHW